MKAYLVLKFIAFFPTVTAAKMHLALRPDPESFDFAEFFQQWDKLLFDHKHLQ